jgi:hypothetical protein
VQTGTANESPRPQLASLRRQFRLSTSGRKKRMHALVPPGRAHNGN